MKAKVTELCQPNLNDAEVTITYEAKMSGSFFLLTFGGEDLATCQNPKELSRWAFSRGAQKVRHDYDLRLGEEFF